MTNTRNVVRRQGLSMTARQGIDSSTLVALVSIVLKHGVLYAEPLMTQSLGGRVLLGVDAKTTSFVSRAGVLSMSMVRLSQKRFVVLQGVHVDIKGHGKLCTGGQDLQSSLLQRWNADL